MERIIYHGERALKFSGGELYTTANMAGSQWLSDEQYFDALSWNRMFATVYRSANIMPESLALAFFRNA